jgi:hypothetical protein
MERPSFSPRSASGTNLTREPHSLRSAHSVQADLVAGILAYPLPHPSGHDTQAAVPT